MSNPKVGRDPDTWRILQLVDDRVAALERAAQIDRYDFLGAFTRSADKTLLTFASIPQNYSHLRVVFIGQSTRSGFPNTGFRFNFSTVAGTISSAWNFNYWGYGNGAGGVIQGQSAGGGSGYLGQTPAANRTNDNYVSHGTIDIPFYSRNDTIKSFLVNSTTHDGASLFQGMNVNNTNTATAAAMTGMSIFDDVVGSGSTHGPRSTAHLFGIL